jgi:NAD(P)-dependent dehydrogenase (short-subunit alcohol dehydrogenase family)
MTLEHKTALVTGATSGIGRAIAPDVPMVRAGQSSKTGGSR